MHTNVIRLESYLTYEEYFTKNRLVFRMEIRQAKTHHHQNAPDFLHQLQKMQNILTKEYFKTTFKLVSETTIC